MSLKDHARPVFVSAKGGFFKDDITGRIGYVFYVILFREIDEVFPDTVKII